MDQIKIHQRRWFVLLALLALTACLPQKPNADDIMGVWTLVRTLRTKTRIAFISSFLPMDDLKGTTFLANILLA